MVNIVALKILCKPMTYLPSSSLPTVPRYFTLALNYPLLSHTFSLSEQLRRTLCPHYDFTVKVII